MHAIAAAREGVELRIREEGMSGRTDLPLLRVYVSEQSHSSIEKGVIALGLGQRGLRKIPTDTEFRMDVHELNRAIVEDKAKAYIPFCIVATVGTTSTSSIDPVPDIIPIGEEHAMWLHVDAAYAGSAAVVPELRHVLAGCKRADSVQSIRTNGYSRRSTFSACIAGIWISCDGRSLGAGVFENAGTGTRAQWLGLWNSAGPTLSSTEALDDHSLLWP